MCSYLLQALEVLLDLSSPSCRLSRNDRYSSFSASNGENPRGIDFGDNVSDMLHRSAFAWKNVVLLFNFSMNFCSCIVLIYGY